MPRTTTPEEDAWHLYKAAEEELTKKGYDPMYIRTVEELRDLLGRITVRQGSDLKAPTDKQRIRISEYWLKRYRELAPKGVRVRLIRYAWGTPVRFTIPGRRGWFKWRSVKEFLGLS